MERWGGGRRAACGRDGGDFCLGGRQAAGGFDDGGRVRSELTGGCFCYDERAAPREVMGGWERQSADDLRVR